MAAVQFILHYGGHWLVPLVIARVVANKEWLRFAIVMLAANLIDLDHLLAEPMFDPGRCSIGFHPLHGWVAALAYLAALAVPRWWARGFGLGALWHLAVDYGDCLMQGG